MSSSAAAPRVCVQAAAVPCRPYVLLDGFPPKPLAVSDATLEAARERLRGGGEKLQQLCLVVADGRFHEKEALRRRMREMAAKPGVLVAFIVLDNPKSSVLDMQSVAFENGTRGGIFRIL